MKNLRLLAKYVRNCERSAHFHLSNNRSAAIASQRRFSSMPALEEEHQENINKKDLLEQVQINVNSSPKARLDNDAEKMKQSLSTVAIEGDEALRSSPAMDSFMEEESFHSSSHLTYTGGATMPVTSNLHIVKPGEDMPRGVWPVFRLMDECGRFRHPVFDAENVDSTTSSCIDAAKNVPGFVRDDENAECNLADLRKFLTQVYPFHAEEMQNSELLNPSEHVFPDTNSKNTLLRAHRQLIRLREMDTILQNAQRQGRISFYMTCRGEEAMHIGAAAALDLGDTILSQYREAGVLMWRGFTLDQFCNQNFSNDLDLGKGRQMPIHYGSRALNFQTISSPLGTQIPQAAGVAYRLKLAKKKNVAVCFFGDGCASTTDFHSGLNFAATLQAPVIFFCRNNGYAISTPVTEQYAGDGIVSRGPGYGMASIRVDGNDIFAVNAAVREAKKYALENNAPVLIEGMSYRQGHHSTSDDSTRYRCANEVKEFTDQSDPLTRFENFLKHNDLTTEEEISIACNEERMAVLRSMEQAEKRPPPSIKDLFTDVYSELPPRLQEQQKELYEHMEMFPENY